MLSKFPYSRQKVDKEDIDSVTKVLRSDFLTQGPKSVEFEKKLSVYTGAKYVSAVNSATSGLYLACRALGLKKNDYAWTTPNTFVSSANCIINCGAKVDFVDIDYETNNLCASNLEKKLIKAKKDKKLPALLIPVHIGGTSCNMKKIKELSKKYGFFILEDASHCIGGRYKDTPIGSCRYSDVCVFSFHPVKIITTGEGGIATTNNKKIDSRLKNLRSHGLERNQKEFKLKTTPSWYYEQHALGFNYRLNEIQASLGISQMKKLDNFIGLRIKIAKSYDKKIMNPLIIKPDLDNHVGSSFHLYIVKVKERDRFHEYLKENKIFTTVHYFPIHMQPYYQALGFKNGDFPESEKYGYYAISLPIYPDLNKQKLNKVIKIINNFK